MLLGLGVNAVMQRANQLEIRYLKLSYYNCSTLISNVAVKNSVVVKTVMNI